MRTFTTTTIAALTIAAMSLSSSADAGCGGGRRYHRVRHHYTPHVVHHEPIYKTVYVPKPIIQKVVVEKPVYIPTPVPVQPAPCFRPTCGHCVVLPGDTLCTIAKRVYGTPQVWSLLAKYNQLTPMSPLTVGQPLQMPTINQNGTFRQPVAPVAPAAPQGFQMPQLPPAQAAPVQGLPQAGNLGGLNSGSLNLGSMQLPNLQAATPAVQ